MEEGEKHGMNKNRRGLGWQAAFVLGIIAVMMMSVVGFALAESGDTERSNSYAGNSTESAETHNSQDASQESASSSSTGEREDGSTDSSTSSESAERENERETENEKSEDGSWDLSNDFTQTAAVEQNTQDQTAQERVQSVADTNLADTVNTDGLSVQEASVQVAMFNSIRSQQERARIARELDASRQRLADLEAQTITTPEPSAGEQAAPVQEATSAVAPTAHAPGMFERLLSWLGIHR
jgi:hypothetical protein